MGKKVIVIMIIICVIIISPLCLLANNRRLLSIIPKNKLDELAKHLPKNRGKLKRLGRRKEVGGNFSTQLKILQTADQMLGITKVNNKQYYGYVKIKVGNSQIFLIFNSAQSASQFMEICYSDLDLGNTERIKEINNSLVDWVKEEMSVENLEENKAYFMKMNIAWFKVDFLNYRQQKWRPGLCRQNSDLREKLRCLVEYKINSPGGLGKNLVVLSENEKDFFNLCLTGIQGHEKEVSYFLEIRNKNERATIVYELDNSGRVNVVSLKKGRQGFVNKCLAAVIAARKNKKSADALSE